MIELVIKIVIAVLAISVFLMMCIAPSCQDYLDELDKEGEYDD